MKIGERVRVVDSDYNALELANGQLGTIVVDGGHYVGVEMDNKHPHMNSSNNYVWNFYVDQVDVIQ